MFYFDIVCAGPIDGLSLPSLALDVLRREEIRTIDQLMAKADQLEQFDGIEPRMAQVIRQALAYAGLPEEETSGEVLLSPWCA
jgi:DNA-directed RNA polymerase alpha subunit